MVIKIEIKAEQQYNNSVDVGQLLHKENETAGEIAFIIAELERTKLELLKIQHGLINPLEQEARTKRLHNFHDL